MPDRDLKVRIASPESFPLDPRNEQTRTPLASIRPAVRIFQHHKRDASRLLQLPDEILWVITQCLAEENQSRYLSQFALAHRECRQLARPYQFADVWITRSELSWAFLRYLRNEDSSSTIPPIGSLIRSLTFTIDRDYSNSWGFDVRGLDPKTADRIEEWEGSWSGILDDLAHVVKSSTPSLDQLYWMMAADLDTFMDLLAPLLQAVLQRASSPEGLRTLYFEDYGLCFSELEELEPVLGFLSADQTFHFRDLAFGSNRYVPAYIDPHNGTALLCETILRRSAPTLESYVWSSDFGYKVYQNNLLEHVAKFYNGPIAFQKLRKFWTYSGEDLNIDPSMLECFLSAPLESFAPSSSMCSVILANALVEKHPLPHLRTFAVIGQVLHIQHSERSNYVDGVFKLGRHYGQHLEELFVYLLADSGLDSQANLLLASHYASGSFSNLRFLCFAWPEDPEFKVLKAIGSNLLTLEELSFGFQPNDEKTAANEPTDETFTCRLNSPPSHDDIRTAIAPLQKLQRLTVFGDEYIADRAGEHWAWHRFFKEHVWYHQGRSFIDREVGPGPGEGQIWSEATRGRIRPGVKVNDWLTPWITRTKSPEEARIAVGDLALKYAEVLPNLQGFISGRVLVEITGPSQH